MARIIGGSLGLTGSSSFQNQYSLLEPNLLETVINGHNDQNWLHLGRVHVEQMFCMWLMEPVLYGHYTIYLSLQSRNYITFILCKTKKKVKQHILTSLHFCIAANIYLNVLSKNDINLLSAFIWLIAHHALK